MDITVNEKESLLQDKQKRIITTDGTTELRVYRRRWWVTAIFCLACMSQAMIYGTWGPIAEAAELLFGWTDETISLLPTVSNISYLIFILPMSMFVGAKGLRITLVMFSTLVLTSSVIRCLTMEPAFFTALTYLAAMLQGMAATITFSGPALFAAVWYPSDERPKATAVISFFNFFGVSAAFLLGPQIVPDPVLQSSEYNVTLTHKGHNLTKLSLWSKSLSMEMNKTAANDKFTVINLEQIQSGIRNLMYTYAGICGLLFILVLIYFPAKPPRPPSVTASLQKVNYKQALVQLASNGPMWIIVVAGALPRAVIASWMVVFDVVAKPLGVSQIDVGWIGFWHLLLGSVSGLFVAKFVDIFGGRRKPILIVFSLGGVICSIWVALLCSGLIRFSTTYLYVSCILLGILANGTLPLFYEMSAETAYPVGEGVAGGYYTFAFCSFEIIYLAFMSIPNIGVTWMTWACLVSISLTIPLLFMFKERNKRTEIDITIYVDGPESFSEKL